MCFTGYGVIFSNLLQDGNNYIIQIGASTLSIIGWVLSLIWIAYNKNLQEVTKRDFFIFFDKHPLFKDNVILEIDEFYIFFYDAIKKGTLPAFEFDLKNNVILLDDNRVGHVKPGIDIKNLMIEQIQKRINPL